MATIAKLRLKNFKSFNKALIPFSQGFTSIAGSNGSGKSNILDALMFVLGITSLKTLRASKLTDLVNHNATEGYALVEIELQNKENNYMLSREIDKKGVSVFRLNGKRSTLNEANSLLNELGIRADGYNIVVQGDITRIIEMNAVERREIIDDLAGLREYDEKKGEALKELDKVDQKIKEVTIVLKERESYLEEIKKEREAALEHQKLSAELQQTKATLLDSEIKKINKESNEFQEKKMEFTQSREKAEGTLKEIAEEEKRIQQKIEELNRKIIESSQKTYAGIGIELEEAKSEKRLSEEKISQRKEFTIRINNRIHSITEKANSIKERKTETKNRIKEIQEKELEFEEKIKEKENQIKKEKERIGSIKEKINRLKEKIKNENIKLNKSKEEFFQSKAESERLKKEIETQEEALKEIKEDLASINVFSKSKGLREKIKGLQRLIEETQKALGKEKAREIEKIKALTKEIETGLKEILEGVEELSPENKRQKIEALQKENAKKFKESFELKSRQEKEIELIEKETEIRERERIELEAMLGEESGTEKELSELKAQKIEAGLQINSFNESLGEMEFNEKEGIKETKDLMEDIDSARKAMAKEEERISELNEKIRKLNIELEKQTQESHYLYEEKEKESTKTGALQEKKLKLEQKISKLIKEENEIEIEKSKNEVRLVDLQEEFKDLSEIKKLEGFEIEELRERMLECDKRIKELGPINLKAIESFEGHAKELIEIKEKSEKLDKERNAVIEMIDKIEVKRLNVFTECFNQINQNFKKMYEALAEGEGFLRLSNELDPLNSGLLIEAKHESEKLKNIDSMSGGEKSLTAIAFLFAIQLYQPAPFYFFDEADAALDKANSVKLARMIRQICSESQFIAITHNDVLIKESDQIIGVALNENNTSVIGLKLREEYEKKIKENNSPEKKQQAIQIA
ncbi:MAG: AAA family ATPase [Candidatus Diapherotrites archaeon]